MIGALIEFATGCGSKSLSDTSNISRAENKPLEIIYVQIWDSWLGDGFYAYSTERNKSGGASPWV
jgi:hypothetical protein